MLNFSVNGETYGVVFHINPVVLPHPRKGLQDSEMLIATVFDKTGPIGSGWSLRSQKDEPNEIKGMKEAFGRAMLDAFADERDIEGVKHIDHSATRASMWKQFHLALAKDQQAEAEAMVEVEAMEEAAEEVMTHLQEMLDEMHSITPVSPVIVVDPFDTPPTATAFVTDRDPADEG